MLSMDHPGKNGCSSCSLGGAAVDGACFGGNVGPRQRDNLHQQSRNDCEGSGGRWNVWLEWPSGTASPSRDSNESVYVIVTFPGTSEVREDANGQTGVSHRVAKAVEALGSIVRRL